MSEFINLRYKELHKDEVIAFGPNLSKLIEPFDPLALGINPALTVFKEEWQKLDPFMQDKKGSPLTQDIVDLDGVRDGDLSGIKLIARGNLNHRNPAKVEAAQLVINTMDGFDKYIPKQQVVVQTKTVFELSKIFSTDVKVKAAMDLLHLTEWVAPMVQTNTELDDIYVNRTQQSGSKPDTTFLEQRPVAEAAYLRLLKVIDSTHTLKPELGLGVLMSQINDLIARANQAIAQRKGKKDKGGKDNRGI